MVIRRGIKAVDFPRVPSAYGIPILMGGLEMSVDHSGYVAGTESDEESRDIAVAAIRDAAPPIVIKRLRRELNLMWGNAHSTQAIAESMMIRSPEPIKKDPIIKVNISVRNRLFLVIQYVGSKTPNTCMPMYEGSANKN